MLIESMITTIKEQAAVKLQTSLLGLGLKPQGQIANSYSPEFNMQLITKAAESEYQQPLDLSCLICVDGRESIEGRNWKARGIYPQTAGGEVITNIATQVLTDPAAADRKLSGCVTQAVNDITAAGRQIQMHGDTHHGPGGCGANANLRPVMGIIADQGDAMINTTLSLMELADLQGLMADTGFGAETMRELTAQAVSVSSLDSFWDIDAAALTKQVRESTAGQKLANYVELVEEHLEKFIIVDLREEVGFDETLFMQQQTDSNGKPVEAFVCSLGAYKKLLMTEAAAGKIDQLTALKRLAAFILFNVGVCVRLTAAENPLPVVVLGATEPDLA